MLKASDLAADIQSRLIVKLSSDGEDIGRFSLEMGEMDKLYFRETIQHQALPEEKNDIKPKMRSHRYILAARKFFDESLRSKIGVKTQQPSTFSLIG